MLGNYQDVFTSIQEILKPFGFSVTEHEDFFSEFKGPGKWYFVIAGDRVAYPGFNLLLIYNYHDEVPQNRKSYSIELLMKEVMVDHLAPEDQNLTLNNRRRF